MQDISSKGAIISGETLSEREREDLNRGRLFTRNLVEEGGCLLADCLQSALASSIQVCVCVSKGDYPSSSPLHCILVDR